MVSSDFRLEARRRLSGKWGKAACITLAYLFVFFVLGIIEGLFPESAKWFFSIVLTVIEVPLSFGLIIAFMKLYNGKEVKAFEFFTLGFSNFAKSWKISLRILLKMLLPIILVIVSFVIIGFGSVGTYTASMIASNEAIKGFGSIAILGFILLVVSMIWSVTKSYYYQLSYFIAVDNPDLTAKEAVEKSQELMAGRRGKLFVLQLTFIGWAILAIIPLCLGYLWLAPYIQLATIAFYKFAIGDNSGIKAEVVTENNDNPIQGE